jgi:aryl-alcohol dehydrogenase-like predicted oxidoreductase
VRTRRPGFAAIAQRFTYLTPSPGTDFGAQKHADQELLRHVRLAADLTLIAYSPLLSGAYSRADRLIPAQYLHAGTPRRLAVLAEVAGKLRATRNQVVLAWLMGGEPSALPIIAVSTVGKLDECFDALNVDLDDRLRARLDRAGT